jgi:hypothetical protein
VIALRRGGRKWTPRERHAAAMASISIMKSGPCSFDSSTSVTADAAGALNRQIRTTGIMP